MTTHNTHELSDAQLSTISGGCYRPEPPKCEPPKPPCYSKPHHDDYDYDYKYKGGWKGWKKFYEQYKEFHDKY